MKYCSNCGKEIMDEAIICVGCGGSVIPENKKQNKKPSTFKRNRTKWIIIFSALFVVFTTITALLLTDNIFSNYFLRAKAEYSFLHSPLGKLGIELGRKGAKIEWQQKVERLKTILIPYCIMIGLFSILAELSLAADIALIVTKDKKGREPERSVSE